MTIIPLSFDSSLFGYPVGKMEVGDQWSETDFLEKAKEYQLVYLYSKKALSITSDQLQLADIKLTFQKDFIPSKSSDPEIFPYSGELTETLLNQALQSGTYSRFKTDPGFVNGEYEKLYRLWIQNALNQKEVLIAAADTGFVSCRISGEKAQIGLIAVDQPHRGKGWGKRLVKAAENFASKQEAKTMIIGTQESNIPAVNLYQNLGYQLLERGNVYHYRQ